MPWIGSTSTFGMLRAALAKPTSTSAPSMISVLDKASVKDGKTKQLASHLEKLGWGSTLIIDGAEVDVGFANAARNIPNVDVLPIQGINVYDIMRRGKLVLTKAALDALEARFK